ncbi:hypothetical protein CKF54_00600 [Psittacicella hinzii]|uniref:Transposase IS4-like domain-containing protein n=1 Tax=Psittacicella hinzii TaxID=2028575 RepID=A0A3A1YB61_9GAMM|nr:transposase [Psittacicella hinzii]RIY34430.1 hypothetical protein CKF54_00600 [Psittacicella hinzii]
MTYYFKDVFNINDFATKHDCQLTIKQNYVYLIRYHDEHGNPYGERKQFSIGRLSDRENELFEPNTKFFVFFPEYKDKSSDAVFSSMLDREKKAQITNVAMALTQTTADLLDIRSDLNEIEVKHADEIIAYASGQVITNGASSEVICNYISASSLGHLKMTSQKVSRLLTGLTRADKENFCALRIARVEDSSSLSFDATNFKSTAKSSYVCKGLGKDGRFQYQIAGVFTVDNNRDEPINYNIYQGNIPDVSVTNTVVEEILKIKSGGHLFVFDRGHASLGHLQFFHDNEVQYLTGLNKSNMAFKKLVAEVNERPGRCFLGEPNEGTVLHEKVIDYAEYLGLDDSSLPVKVCIRFNLQLASQQQQKFLDLYYKRKKQLQTLVDNANKNKTKIKRRYRYFTIEQEESGEFILKELEDKFIQDMLLCGYSILISNNLELSAQEMHQKYLSKDSCEKVIELYKSHLGLRSMKKHSDITIEAHTFISFISVIIRYHLTTRLRKQKIKEDCTKGTSISTILDVLSRTQIKVYEDGKVVMDPLNSDSKMLLRAVGITEKDLKETARKMLNRYN